MNRVKRNTLKTKDKTKGFPHIFPCSLNPELFFAYKAYIFEEIMSEDEPYRRILNP